MNDWTHVGAHTLRLEGDLAFIRLNTLVNAVEGQEFLGIFARVLAECGQLYVLFDNTAGPGIEPAARRLFVNWARSNQITAIANFGGGIMQRTLALLLMNAIRLLVKKVPPQIYAATEAEARTWLDTQRRLHQAGLAA